MDTNKKPLISIIIPVYNCEKFIDECINSAIGQTYQKIEIIIIDDGSTDKTKEICETYKNKHKNIAVYHKANGGLSDARNYGIARANGTYIFLLDGDDIIQENTIEILFSIMKNNEEEISICKLQRFTSNYVNDHKTKVQHFNAKEYFESILLLKNYTYACGILMPKKIVGKNLFIKNRYFEDMASIYKIIDKSKKINKISSGLYKYRLNKDSIVSTINEKKIKDYKKSAQEMLYYISNEYKFKKSLIKTFYYNICRECYIMTKDEKHQKEAKKYFDLNGIARTGLIIKIKLLLFRSQFLTKIFYGKK